MNIVGRCIVACLCVATLAGCGASYSTNLEEAQFALDTGDYASAVTKATAALVATPNDFEATMTLSSALAGRAGVDLLTISSSLADTTLTAQIFSTIHNSLVSVLVGGGQGLNDLRAAITTLTGFGGTVSNVHQYRFQLGLLQSVESFALPTMAAQPASGGTITATAISGTDATNTQNDFIDADNNLILGGLASTNALVTTMRKNYCALQLLSAGGGFTTAELQDLTLCQLSSSAVQNTLTAVAGSFQSGSVATCASFDFTQCATTDTAL